MNENDKPLDQIDRNILRELQKNGRISNVDLAKAIHLSPTPCLERVKRLERQGYIEGYQAILNPDKLDQSLLVFVEVKLDHTTSDVFDELKNWVTRTPQVVECHMTAGGFDYLLKVRVQDMNAYRHLLGEELTALRGVTTTSTFVVMEAVKDGNQVHVK